MAHVGKNAFYDSKGQQCRQVEHPVAREFDPERRQLGRQLHVRKAIIAMFFLASFSMLVNGKEALSSTGSRITMGTYLSAKLTLRPNGNVNAPRVAGSRSSFASIQKYTIHGKSCLFGPNSFVANQKEVKSYGVISAHTIIGSDYSGLSTAVLHFASAPSIGACLPFTQPLEPLSPRLSHWT